MKAINELLASTGLVVMSAGLLISTAVPAQSQQVERPIFSPGQCSHVAPADRPELAGAGMECESTPATQIAAPIQLMSDNPGNVGNPGDGGNNPGNGGGNPGNGGGGPGNGGGGPGNGGDDPGNGGGDPGNGGGDPGNGGGDPGTGGGDPGNGGGDPGSGGGDPGSGGGDPGSGGGDPGDSAAG